MSNEQGDLAVLRQLVNSVHQRVATRVVETVGNFYPIRIELITELQKLKGLPCSYGTRAQHRVDLDSLVTKMGAYLLGIPFTVRSESSLDVPAARSDVFGLGMAKYEQGASLIHPSSLKRRLLAALSGAIQ